jgi:hypothetical protein
MVSVRPAVQDAYLLVATGSQSVSFVPAATVIVKQGLTSAALLHHVSYLVSSTLAYQSKYLIVPTFSVAFQVSLQSALLIAPLLLLACNMTLLPTLVHHY